MKSDIMNMKKRVMKKLRVEKIFAEATELSREAFKKANFFGIDREFLRGVLKVIGSAPPDTSQADGIKEVLVGLKGRYAGDARRLLAIEVIFESLESCLLALKSRDESLERLARAKAAFSDL